MIEPTKGRLLVKFDAKPDHHPCWATLVATANNVTGVEIGDKVYIGHSFASIPNPEDPEGIYEIGPSHDVIAIQPKA